jgi:hypothetical protein
MRGLDSCLQNAENADNEWQAGFNDDVRFNFTVFPFRLGFRVVGAMVCTRLISEAARLRFPGS